MTTMPLHSPYWYRIGPLIARIQGGTRIQRQVLRGTEWFILSHPVSGRHYRINGKAYRLVGRMNGDSSLDALWHGMERAYGDDLPTQDEVIALVAQLANAGLLTFNTVPDWSMLNRQQQTQRRHERKARMNPFAFRLRLFNPRPVLDRLAFLQPMIWHPLTAALAAALVVWGVAHALLEHDVILAYASINLTTPRCLLLAWFAYPLMKGLHELSHALAVRRWGGDVREAGVSFFLLMPAPYVDASDATAFSSKWQRVAVSCAGIAVELLLAAAALPVWMATENGIVRDCAFVIMFIGGMSTLLFNANPLLRFDGYYILCDLIELPNLAGRSQQWWTHLAQRHAGRRSSQDILQADRSERAWLFLYAPTSWIYRLMVSLFIVKWVAAKAPAIALVVAAWMIYALLGQPVWRLMQILIEPAPADPAHKPRLASTGGAALALAIAVCAVPLPASTVATGVVWLPEHSLVRTESDGRIAEILARDGQRVQTGQALAVIEDPVSFAERKRIQAQLTAAETEQVDGWLNDRVKGRNAHENVERLRLDLAQQEDRATRLTLRAAADGVFALPRPDDVLDTEVSKGAVIAYVMADDLTVVRAAMTQDDIGRINEGVKRVSVRLAEDEGQSFDARIVRIDPAAVNRLPSKALGDKGGGSLVTDPADREGLSLLEPVFLVDVQLDERKSARAGGRAWVRLEHEAMPLAETAFLRLRQLFLRVFSAEAR